MDKRGGQAVRDLAGMLLLSLVLLLAAWLTRPVPVVKDSLQTELLSVHVFRDGAYASWYPRDMVQRQTARAIADHLAQCREKNTLRKGEAVLEEAPVVQVCFRTEDTYRVVCLGRRDQAGDWGWSAYQDRSGLAARVQDPGELRAYILEQIGEELFSDTER